MGSGRAGGRRRDAILRRDIPANGKGSKTMVQVTPEEAKSHLEELIEAAMRGEQVVIAHDDQHAVRLVPIPASAVGAPAHRGRTAGTAKGKIVLSDDFDEPLPDFVDYMR